MKTQNEVTGLVRRQISDSPATRAAMTETASVGWSRGSISATSVAEQGHHRQSGGDHAQGEVQVGREAAGHR